MVRYWLLATALTALLLTWARAPLLAAVLFVCITGLLATVTWQMFSPPERSD